MRAIIEYENGDLDERVGLSGYAKEAARAILESDGWIRRVWVRVSEDPLSQEELQELLEQEEPTAEVSWVEIVRSDGETALVRIVSEKGDDIWTAIGRDYPAFYELADETAIVQGPWNENVPLSFEKGEEDDLLEWFRQVTARVVMRDTPPQAAVLKEITDEREAAVEAATEWAFRWCDGQSCDQSQLDVVVMVGDDEVWSWLEATEPSDQEDD